MAHHFFLPAIATTMVAIFLFVSPTRAATSAVVDTDGNPLTVDSQYYVLTAGTGGKARGGLTYIPKPPSWTCPAYVGQHKIPTENGYPLSLIPANQTQKQIFVGDDVAILFGEPNYCKDVGAWRLTPDNKTKFSYVATDGDMDHPESPFYASLFKILKTSSDKSYKIVHCDKRLKAFNIMMGVEADDCQQLDATQDGPIDINFLSLVPVDSHLPFVGFVFKKASPPTITTTTTAAYY